MIEQTYGDAPIPRAALLEPTSLTGQQVEEVTVLVTGFGPFDPAVPINPSWTIASALPPLLEPDQAHPSRIRILVHPAPVRVSYKAVQELIPAIYQGAELPSAAAESDPLDGFNKAEAAAQVAASTKPRIDMVLHIGMAGKRDYFAFETVAHRDGYDKLDVDKEIFTEDNYWKDYPESLEPTVAVDDVWRRWKSDCMDEDVRPSTNAGRYLCEFIFYASLAYFSRQGKGNRPVLFLHVPADLQNEADIARGRQVAIGLIRAMVDSRRQKAQEE